MDGWMEGMNESTTWEVLLYIFFCWFLPSGFKLGAWAYGRGVFGAYGMIDGV